MVNLYCPDLYINSSMICVIPLEDFLQNEKFHANLVEGLLKLFPNWTLDKKSEFTKTNLYCYQYTPRYILIHGYEINLNSSTLHFFEAYAFIKFMFPCSLH